MKAVVFVLALSTAARLSAAPADGGLAANFLSFGADVRTLGMGGAWAARGGDAAAVVWNPANLALLPRTEMGAGGALLPAGANYSYLVGAYPTALRGTFGGAFARLGSGAATTRDDENRATGSYTGSHSAIAIGYGRDWRFLRAGFSVVALRQALPGASEWGVTALFGLAGDLSRVSRAFRGLSAGLRGAHLVPSRVGVSRVPLSLRLGLAYRLFRDQILVALDAEHVSQRSLRLWAGGEYAHVSGFSARLGWSGPPGSPGDGSPSAGVGFRYGRLRTDYGVALLPLGLTHRVGLAAAFGPDVGAPTIEVTNPAFDAAGKAIVSSERATLEFTVLSRSPLAQVRVAGRPVKLTDQHRFSFRTGVNLREGKNAFKIDAETQEGTRAERALEILADTLPPAIQILEPKSGAHTTTGEIFFQVLISDATEIHAVSLHDQLINVPVEPRVEVRRPIRLRWGGRNLVRIAATDKAGQTGFQEIEVHWDGGPPPPAGSAAASGNLDEQVAREALEKGREYLAAKRYDLALLEFRYATKRSPGLAEAKTLAAQAERELARQQAATAPAAATPDAQAKQLAEVRRAIETHFTLAKQLLDAGQYKRAQGELRLVLELNRDYQAAIDLLQSAQARMADYVGAKLKEARSFRSKGDLVAELGVLRDASTQDENHPLVKEMLAEATAKIPQEKRNLHLKALELYAEDKLEDAVKIWKRALLLDSGDEKIRTSLEKAERRLIEQKSGGK